MLASTQSSKISKTSLRSPKNKDFPKAFSQEKIFFQNTLCVIKFRRLALICDTKQMILDELVKFSPVQSDNAVVCAISRYLDSKGLSLQMCSDLPTDICEALTVLSTIYNLSAPQQITGYKQAIALLSEGGLLVSSGFCIPNLRDRAGFCVPTDIGRSPVYYSGFVDNYRRPALIVQQTENLEFPRGNDKLTLSTQKIVLPPGAWMLDAEHFISGWSLS